MRALRIGIDGHGFESPAGGVRRYASELTRALLACEPTLHISVVGAAAHTVLPSGVHRIPARPVLPTNLGWCLAGLPHALRRLPLDVFHAPAYTAPLWGAPPLVVTLHDVSYERHPEWYPHQRDWLRRWFYRRSALAASLVITDSEFSRHEIDAAYGIGTARIRVIPLGVSAPFATTARAREQPSPLTTPTLLHVGDLHPRRNVEMLVQALALLRQDQATRSATLVLAGRDRGSAGSIVAQAKTAGVLDAVHFVTDADDDTIVTLMRDATVFAYPSLYEGFGLPVLEAMACGTPVVAARAGSIPEVVGDAGILVAPHDVRAWHEALRSVLTSAALGRTLSDAGAARAAQFSWERTAAHTLAVYRELAGPGALG